MKIVYRLVNGEAKDIRLAEDDYTLAAGETAFPGDELPPKGSLNDVSPEAVDARDTTKRQAILNNSLNKLLFVTLLDLENRMRSLESRSPITPQAYRDNRIALWKTL